MRSSPAVAETRVKAQMSQCNELTDSQYWDAAWSRFGHIKRLSRRHGMLGKNGFFVRAMRRHAGKVEGRRVAELGGGASYRLLALAKWERCEVVAVDYSSEGLKRTAELFRTNGEHVETIQEDFLRWTPQGEKFDVVTHWGVIEHFRDATPILKLCAELAKDDGRIVFGMPNMSALGHILWERWSPANWERHVYHSDEYIEQACQAAGLRLEKRFHFGPPLIMATDPEKRTWMTRAATLLHRGLYALCWALPIYDRGFLWLSSERGFVARKLK